jgi:hypothetical protein
MLRWFGKKRRAAARGEDKVWMTDAARLAGLRAEVASALRAGRAVCLVAWTEAGLDQASRLIGERRPLYCRDLFGQQSLVRHLGGSGAVAVALAGALPANVPETADAEVDVLVLGRSESRPADDAVVRFADAFGPRASVSFHLSFEDALLGAHAERLMPLLERLGMKEGEAVSHAMVSRAIARAQEKT